MRAETRHGPKRRLKGVDTVKTFVYNDVDVGICVVRVLLLREPVENRFPSVREVVRVQCKVRTLVNHCQCLVRQTLFIVVRSCGTVSP